MPPSLDLSRFHGYDTPTLYRDQERLDLVRNAFAHAVTECAVTCRNNAELLDALYMAMPPAAGLGFPTKLGEGSTRKAFSLPFGLVLKLQRTDDLTPEEMRDRGSRTYLDHRRRMSNFCEMVTGVYLPNAATRIFGFVAAFGKTAPNPSVLISEHVTTLEDERPTEHIGVANEDIAFCGRTGELRIFDRRFSDQERASTDKPFAATIPTRETGIWLGNIGTDSRGRFRLLDGGNFGHSMLDMNVPDYLPILARENKWEECSPLGPKHLEQTRMYSEIMMGAYRYQMEAEAWKGGERDHGTVQTA